MYDQNEYQEEMPFKNEKPLIARKPLYDEKGDCIFYQKTEDEIMAELQPHDNSDEQIGKYSPFNHVFNVMIDKYNMALAIRMIPTNIVGNKRMPLNFTGKDGKEYSMPIFPVNTAGTSIMPLIVGAKVLGDGIDTADVNVTREFVASHVTDEDVFQAIINFYDDIKHDGNAPRPLVETISDYIQSEDYYSGGGYGDYDEDYDEDYVN